MVVLLVFPEKGTSPDQAAPFSAGSAFRARVKLWMVLGAMLPAYTTTMPSLSRPRSMERAKDIWANTTNAAMPSPIETANCVTTSAVRARPGECQVGLARSTLAGRKPDSTSAG